MSLGAGNLAVLLVVGCTGHKVEDTDGREDPHPDTAVGPRRWAYVEAGAGLTCGIDLHGRAECWGLQAWNAGSDTSAGGSSYDYSVLFPPALSFQTIALGMSVFTYGSGNHACGLLTGGGVACWGHERTSETDPPAGVFMQVEADGGASWGVTMKGELRCWGDCYAVPSEPYRSVSQVFGYGAAVNTHGDVESWAGPGPTSTVRGPFVSATGGELSCGIREDGALTCWFPEQAADPAAQEYAPTGSFTQVCGSFDFDCALGVDGLVVCFGLFPSDEILKVPSIQFAQISCGEWHACGLTPDHEIVCWGDLSHGEGTPPD